MMFQKGASDLHLAHNNPITFRISGQIKKLEAYVTGRNIFNLLNESNVLSKEALRRLNEENATDFATEYGGARFRGVLTRSRGNYTRSEEHTSELQSRGHLVCRLLLEKKNNKD